MSFTDYLENELLDHLFGKSVWVPPATVYVGLSTADPGETAAGIAEPAGNNYARVAIANNKTTWTTSTDGTLSNAITIDFPTASGAWGTLTHFFIADAANGGNVLCYSTLATARTITADMAVSFSAGELDITVN